MTHVTPGEGLFYARLPKGHRKKGRGMRKSSQGWNECRRDCPMREDWRIDA